MAKPHFGIAERVRIPDTDGVQGVVISSRSNFTAGSSYILWWIKSDGCYEDGEFDEFVLRGANTPPVDVAALTLQRDQYANRITELQRKLAEHVARKSKSKKRK